MVEKSEKKKNRLRLPAALVLLISAALMLALGEPHGAAADSPVQPESPAVASVPQTETEAAPVEHEEPHVPVGLVPESAPVADTYFENVAFLGDSRTEGFELYSGLDAGTYYHAVGATVESVFTKNVETEIGEMPLLDAMAEAEFDKIYVMLGVNELGWNGTEIYHDQYARLIDRLREDHPDAEVVLQTILPVSAKQDAEQTYVNNTRIKDYNEVVEALAQEKECPYLNVAEAVTDENGCLRSEWTSDGVHLNAKGCKIWLEYLRTHPVGEIPEHATPETVLPDGTVQADEN